MNREEAAAAADILRLLPHCHFCHVRPATRVLKLTKKAEGGRQLTFACDHCDKDNPALRRFSYADSVVLLHVAITVDFPGLYNPDPHHDHRNTKASEVA